MARRAGRHVLDGVRITAAWAQAVSVGIMLLPAEGQLTDEIPDAHCTIVWAGDLSELPSTEYMAMHARCAFLAATQQAFEALVVGTDLFGEGDERTKVLLLADVRLGLLRHWTKEFSRSQYTEFKPHVSYETISTIPQALTFDRLALWVGDKRTDSSATRFTWQLGTQTNPTIT